MKFSRSIFPLLTAFVSLLLFQTPAYSVTSDNVIKWAGCGITKKAFMAELAKAYEKKTGVKVELSGGGATRGIRDTVKLQMDMGGSCRMSLPEEDRSELHASLHPVAWDALVVIINKKNPVTNLTTKQVQDIFSGKVTNWRQIGGQNVPVHLYIRTGKISGVGYAIRQYLFEDSTKEFKTSKEFIKRSSGPIERGIEKDISGIAITGVSSARKRQVKIISLDNRSPTYENVRDGKYGLYRPLYLVTTPTPSPKVKKFVSFARSKEGRKIIRDNGTVPYMDAPQLMSKMLIYGFGVR